VNAARAVLRGNDTGRYTLPSRTTYPHQWNWDSALAALGWAELDPARAWTELESLAGARDRDGLIPHIAFRSGLLPRLTAARYLPGPRWWGRRTGSDGRRISGITQPPLAATRCGSCSRPTPTTAAPAACSSRSTAGTASCSTPATRTAAASRC